MIKFEIAKDRKHILKSNYRRRHRSFYQVKPQIENPSESFERRYFLHSSVGVNRIGIFSLIFKVTYYRKQS